MLKKILFILSEKKLTLLFLFSIFNLASLLEILGIGLIFPYLELLSNPDTQLMTTLMVWTGISNRDQLFIYLSITLVVVYIIKNILLFLIRLYNQRYTYTILKRIRDRLLARYMYAPYEFHLQRNSNILLTNINNHAGRFALGMLHPILAATAEAVFLGFVAVSLFIWVPASIPAIALLGTFIFLFYRYTKARTFRYGQINAESTAALMNYINQGILSLKTARIHHVEDFFITRAGVQSSRIIEATSKHQAIILSPRLVIEVLLVSIFAGVAVYYSLQQQNTMVSLPVLATLAAATIKVLPSINKLITEVSQIKNNEPIVNIIYEEFQTTETLFQREQTISAEPVKFEHSIKLNNLSFCYQAGETPALQHLNLTVEKGQSVGIIGPSGAGKSTLVDVLLGLLAPQQGDIQVDGQSILSRERDWQELLGYVPQSIYLLDDTIRRNIAFGLANDEINDERLDEVIKAASLTDIVTHLPQRANTVIGENGVRLSGGQRQRIGIARALYKNPEILILDEATSALDNETEQVVAEAIDALSQHKTLIIIAHRLTTLKNCDIIYRLEAGRLVGSGSYDKIIQPEYVSSPSIQPIV